MMNEQEFIQSMTSNKMDDKATLVLNWATQLPVHYRCFSSRTNRISFRLPGKENNCNLRNAFLTILLGINGFRYLLNGEGVDMNNQQNWISSNYNELNNQKFLEAVILNYENR
jgi:hypothetical protein